MFWGCLFFCSLSSQDLDSFLTWLVQTQTVAASDQLPNDLEEAETLINKHAALKEEIGRWDIEILHSVPHFQAACFPENTTGIDYCGCFHTDMKRTMNDCNP